jgi:hypothetical protein
MQSSDYSAVTRKVQPDKEMWPSAFFSPRGSVRASMCCPGAVADIWGPAQPAPKDLVRTRRQAADMCDSRRSNGRPSGPCPPKRADTWADVFRVDDGIRTRDTQIHNLVP